MTYATMAASTNTAPAVAIAEPQSALETTFSAALEHARRLTAMYGTNNTAVTFAWEAVGELNIALAQKQVPARTAFACYCDAHPDAPEARIYEV